MPPRQTGLHYGMFNPKELAPALKKVESQDIFAPRQTENMSVISKYVPHELHACGMEIEFCYRFLDGTLDKRKAVREYGLEVGNTGDETVEAVARRLLAKYERWVEECNSDSPRLVKAIIAVFCKGQSIQQIKSQFRFSGFEHAAQYLLYGLNRYSIIRGWGNTLAECIEHSDGFVYVIGQKNSAPYKIGYSATPLRRLTELQIGSPVLLEILFLIKVGRRADQILEAELHRHFKSLHSHGEWFDAPLDEMKDVIRLMCLDGVELSPADPMLRS